MTNDTSARTGELGARASTQRGETGDKIPGYDPAAAPMETDAEAGGAPFGGPADAARAEATRPPETSTGTAMRPLRQGTPDGPGRSRSAPRVVLVLLAAVAALLILVFLLGG